MVYKYTVNKAGMNYFFPGHKSEHKTNVVFNFPRFYSIFCVDFSQLFDPFHTYLKHGTVMGSNICEWKQKYL